MSMGIPADEGWERDTARQTKGEPGDVFRV